MRRPLHTFLPLLVGLVFLVGCEVGEVGNGTGGSGGGDDDTPLDCEPPLPPTDPNTLPACCELFAGNGHCVPDDVVPDDVQEFTGACDDGASQCIPDKFIESGGIVELQSCTFHLNGEPGKCLSVCIPQVQDNIALLQQDVCDPDEMCVPCINPIDSLPTGICELDFSCEASDDDTPPDDTPPEATCPYVGPPIIDPNSFPACTTCGGAHCVPNDLVPGEFGDRLAACDTTSKCVPDNFIESAGNTIPATCDSVAGAEGRCLSKCLPEVIDQAALLPQSTCPATELCVPCYNPLDGLETGACGLSCDPGPTEAPVALPACCGGIGTCVPAEAAGDQADQLGEDTCEDEGFLCAPNVFIEGDFTAQSCETGAISLLFGDEFRPGACLPECIPAVDNFLIGQDGCLDNYKCAPCLDPLSGEPTGACDYLP
jgi:hypothetical protein